MKETYWGYWLFLLGVFVIGVMLLTNNISTTNTQDYYNIKEVTQASMIDAVDFSYYRLYGTVKMSEQKFVENFIRRFSENVNFANTYDIGFYDLIEVPPKVSVRISTGSRAFNIGNSRNDYDVVTTINAILELGLTGDGREGGNESQKRSCSIFIGSQFIDYLKGKLVDKQYTLAADGCDLSYNQNELEQFDATKNMDEFRKWFVKNVKMNGSTIKSYLEAFTKYDDLPQCVKNWHQRGWIQIH